MSEIVYDGNFSNLEVDKLYTTQLTSNISASLTLDKLDSGTTFFVDASANHVQATLPAATVGAGITYRFVLTAVHASLYHLRLTSASNIIGLAVSHETSPPGTTLVTGSDTTVTMITAGVNLLTIGSRISVISNGVSWYINDDLSNVPLVFS